jgi:hypothetical protein
MDFKGQKGSRAAIGPLSLLDDHSRYLVALVQTGTTRSEAVRQRLEGVFRAHGLPEAMLMDHGVPWWGARAAHGYTQLSAWLMKQGVRCYFSGLRHPQTQGKVERFHGALERARARPGAESWLEQSWLDAFGQEYKELRPHEALAMRTPASLWRPSPRRYDPHPPAWDYGPTSELRQVNTDGDIHLAQRKWPLAMALRHQTVELKRVDQRVLVFFCHTLIREIDLGGGLPRTCKGCPDNEV